MQHDRGRGANDVIGAHFSVPLCSAFFCLLRSQEGDSLRVSSFQGQVQQKDQVFALGKVLIKVYSDWTSLGLGLPSNQSYLAGRFCSLIGHFPARAKNGGNPVKSHTTGWRGWSPNGDSESCWKEGIWASGSQKSPTSTTGGHRKVSPAV